MRRDDDDHAVLGSLRRVTDRGEYRACPRAVAHRINGTGNGKVNLWPDLVSGRMSFPSDDRILRPHSLYASTNDDAVQYTGNIYTFFFAVGNTYTLECSRTYVCLDGKEEKN